MDWKSVAAKLAWRPPERVKTTAIAMARKERKKTPKAIAKAMATRKKKAEKVAAKMAKSGARGQETGGEG